MIASTVRAVDDVFIYIMAFSILLFALIVFVTIYFVVRYHRSRNPEPSQSGGNWLLELGAIAVATALALSMFFYGLTGFSFLRAAPAGALAVRVTARQWSWLFEYENGKRSPELVVPRGRAVALDMISSDVIHSFFAPAYRVKQDVLPAVRTRAWFRGDELGASDILCAEYCGAEHSRMVSRIVVVAPGDFARWYEGGSITLPGASGAVHPIVAALRLHGCLDCHSLDGAPGVGPTFKGLFGREVRVTASDGVRTVVVDEEYLRRSIADPGAEVVEGFRNIMPAEAAKERLTDAEVHELAGYLNELR